MKKIFKLLLIIFLISVNVFNLKADCESDKENVKDLRFTEMNYIQDDKYMIGFEAISPKVDNDLYFEIYKNDELIDTTEMQDDYASYIMEYDNKELTIKVKVYSSACEKEALNEYECLGLELNKYSSLPICNELPGSSELCSQFADTKDMSEADFIKAVKKDTRQVKTILGFKLGIKRYYLYAVIPFAVAALVFIVAVIVLKKKGKKFYRGGNKK